MGIKCNRKHGVEAARFQERRIGVKASSCRY